MCKAYLLFRINMISFSYRGFHQVYFSFFSQSNKSKHSHFIHLTITWKHIIDRLNLWLLNFFLCMIFVVSLSLLKSDRQLNCPVYHNTVQLYCTPVHPTVRVSAWAGVKYQANNTIRPPTFTTRCLLQFFYCLPPQIQGFYCSFYKGHGVLWKIWQNICKPARTLFMELEWRVKNCRYGPSDMKRNKVSDIELCWWTFNYIDRWQK